MSPLDPDVERAMLRFECAFCGALSGMPCMVPNGRPAAMPHTARYVQWREAVAREHKSE